MNAYTRENGYAEICNIQRLSPFLKTSIYQPFYALELSLTEGFQKDCRTSVWSHELYVCVSSFYTANSFDIYCNEVSSKNLVNKVGNDDMRTRSKRVGNQQELKVHFYACQSIYTLQNISSKLLITNDLILKINLFPMGIVFWFSSVNLLV